MATPTAIPTASIRSQANPYSMAGEYGPSSLDIRHRAFIGGTITTLERIQLAPFLLMNSGAPFNIATGTDAYGTTLLTTARPAIASGPGPGIIYYDGLYLEPESATGRGTLGRNFGRGPGSINFNLRVARTWGFGKSREDTGAPRPRGGGGGGGPRGGPGGGARGPAAGRSRIFRRWRRQHRKALQSHAGPAGPQHPESRQSRPSERNHHIALVRPIE